MSTMETAEEIVTIMECCSAAYQKRKEEKPSEAILVMLTTRCHSQLISNTIQKSRSSAPKPQQTNEARQASEKQLKYIEDLGGDRTKIHTASEASEAISRLRDK